ncbi:MAG: hypothetical protein ACK5JJ_13800 [Cyanobacteriota bacterium]|jgi:hypothetical protein
MVELSNKHQRSRISGWLEFMAGSDGTPEGIDHEGPPKAEVQAVNPASTALECP